MCPLSNWVKEIVNSLVDNNIHKSGNPKEITIVAIIFNITINKNMNKSM